jgi:hypothetical protein
MTQHEAEISIEIKAVGYHSKVDKIRVQPGPNSHPVNLTALRPAEGSSPRL